MSRVIAWGTGSLYSHVAVCVDPEKSLAIEAMAWKGIRAIDIRMKHKANYWQKENDYFCSELCYECFFEGGLDIVPQVPDSDITAPGDIAKSEVVSKVEDPRRETI